MTAKKEMRPPGLRFLDLSLAAGADLDTPWDNGLHPHVGYKGAKRHPPSPYLYDKGRDVHKRLREDVERVMEDAMLEVHGTPSWAVFASREITHSGESPLFLHKYLAPSKVDDHSVPLRPQRSSAKSLPPKTNGHLYYRPNRTHQYLTATELKDHAETDVKLRYGRPTRTTLLRARQRSNSAPMNAYEIRREMIQRMETVKSNCPIASSKEVCEFVTEDGSTHHAFLTGARYNRAHCLDSRVLTLYGVYMPRHNPLASFFTGTPRLLLDTPGTPPDSPRSDVERQTQSAPVSRPRTAPNYGRRPMPANANVNGHVPHWGDANASQTIPNGRHDNVHEEVLIWPYSLSVKGRGLSGNGRGQSSVLPSVTGVSVSRMRQVRLSTTEALEHALDANVPLPTSALPTPHLNEQSEEEAGASERVALPTPTTPKPEEPEKKPPTRPATVDRSIMVPSVGGDVDEVKDSSNEESPQASPSTKISPGGETGEVEAEKKEAVEVEDGVEGAAEVAPTEAGEERGGDSGKDATARETTADEAEQTTDMGDADAAALSEAERLGEKPDKNATSPTNNAENVSDEAPAGDEDKDANGAENEKQKKLKSEKNSSLFVRNSANAPDQTATKTAAQPEAVAASGDAGSTFFLTEGESEKATEKVKVDAEDAS